MKTTLNEMLMVLRYINMRQANHLRDPKLYHAVDVNSVVVERKSDRLFDLRLEGRTSDGVVFGAWLVLGMIGELPWTQKNIAEMTDYPSMCMRGDWSGVRDTDEDKLWAIFHKFFTLTNG
jgi:hypothetical protein